MHPAMNDLSQLPVAERLEIVQQLWDSIAESKEQLSIHDWQRELIAARLANFDGREETDGLSRDEMWRQVERRRGS